MVSFRKSAIVRSFGFGLFCGIQALGLLSMHCHLEWLRPSVRNGSGSGDVFPSTTFAHPLFFSLFVIFLLFLSHSMALPLSLSLPLTLSPSHSLLLSRSHVLLPSVLQIAIASYVSSFLRFNSCGSLVYACGIADAHTHAGPHVHPPRAPARR